MATKKDAHEQHDQHEHRESHGQHEHHEQHQQHGTPQAGQAPPNLHGDFPESVRQGYWIYSPDQHAQHPGQSLVTRSHDVITAWAAERSCVPATIPSTWHGDHPGVLRFDFPDWGSNERLEHVTWAEWFGTFDERELVMIFQENMENGHMSNFFHMNSPFREHQ